MSEVGNRYLWPINIQQSAATVADKLVWSLWNAGLQKSARVELLEGTLYMAGAVSALLGGVGYYLARLSGAAPSAGTALPYAKQISTDPDANVVGRFLDTGLTVTSTTIGGGFHHLIMPASAAGFRGDFSINLADYPITLAPGEGIGIALANTAIALMGIRGRARVVEN